MTNNFEIIEKNSKKIQRNEKLVDVLTYGDVLNYHIHEEKILKYHVFYTIVD